MTLSATELTPASLKGELSLAFRVCHDTGTTRLGTSYRTGLFHFSKPYWDGEQLVVQVLNPTAGVFGGDRLESSFRLGVGSRGCILSPSSNQVYAMPGKDTASSSQVIDLESGAACVYLPKWLVLHQSSRFSQDTIIRLAGDAVLLYADLLSAGRSSFGEFLQFEQFHSNTEIWIDGRLFLKDRILCGNERNRWIWYSRGQRFCYLANVYLHFPGAGTSCENAFSGIPATLPSGTGFGYTVLSGNFISLRILGASCRHVETCLKRIIGCLPDTVPASPVFARI